MAEKTPHSPPAENPASITQDVPAIAASPALPRWMLWLALAIGIVATVAAGIWLARFIEADRAMRLVATHVAPQVAALQTDVQANVQAAPLPAAAPVVDSPGDPGPDGRGESLMSTGKMPAVAPLTAPTVGATVVPERVPGRDPDQNIPAVQKPEQAERAVTAEALPARDRAVVPKPQQRQRQEAPAAAPTRSQEIGTFRRCPKLGEEGAVICRWHICNGAAGKEAACRPYLERRP